MDVSSQFESVSITGTKQFSWVFIVDWILAFIITIFIIFYFNRMVGTLLSTIFRWYLWHRHRIRLKVQSVQVSLLGGRVFFRNLTYVGSNEVICALQGNVTWRYWLHRRRLSKLETDHNEGGHVLSDEQVPTRLAVQMDGFEWFVFNRSAAYDSLFDYYTKQRGTHTNNTTQTSEDGSSSSDIGSSSQHTQYFTGDSSDQPKVATGSGSGDSSHQQHASSSSSYTIVDSLFIRLMPIQLRCSKGAIVVGNRNTPSLLVLHFNSAAASADVGPTENKLDKYQMIMHTKLIHPILEMRPNIDYEGPNAVERVKSKKRRKNRMIDALWSNAGKFIHRLRRRASHDSGEEEWDEKFQWKGLSRYLTRENGGNGSVGGENINKTNVTPNEDDDDTELAEEYGKYSTLIDAPEASMTYYYDLPGVVPFSPDPTPKNAGPDVGNGGTPPRWGAVVTLTESTIHYGPWADRQRVPLQSMLFPRYCCDATPAGKQLPGNDRIYTIFDMQVNFVGDNIIRFPTREFSKNEQFMKAYRENPNDSLRPFGWFELKTKDCSSISITSHMVASRHGSENSFLVDFKYPELRSSVNHGLLFSAMSHRINVTTHYPLRWNGLQNWRLENNSFRAKTFFLREHVTLLTDLLKDFSSGPPVQYELFTPVKYDFKWVISDYAVYLNVNDLNIINNPSDFEDNTFISFQGEQLVIDVGIPMEQIYQNRNRVEFNISTPRFDLVIDAPPWHTVHGFVETPSLGRAHDFKLDASYTYFSEVAENNADTLVLDIDGSDVTFIAYGFILKYLMKIRENYFGEHFHFQTLEEYFSNEDKNDKIEYKHERDDTDLDVLFYVSVNKGTVILPANLYSPKSNIQLDFANLDADLRFTNYYMDLQLSFSPIKGKYNSITRGDILNLAKNHHELDNMDIFIDGLVIHGHRLFGLPPTEPTYFCKWDFDIGAAIIDGEFEVLQALGRVGAAFGYSYKDVENSLILNIPTLYDVLYLSLNVQSVKVLLHADDTTLEVETGGISLALNDLSNDRYSARMNLKVPTINTCVFEKKQHSKKLAASFSTSVILTNFAQKREFNDFHEQQQEHIALHDRPFQRCPFLLDRKHRLQYDDDEYIRPSLSLPGVPLPLTSDTVPFIDPGLSTRMMVGDNLEGSSVSSKSNRGSSSFGDKFYSSSVESLHTAASSSRVSLKKKVPLTPFHTLPTHIKSDSRASSVSSRGGYDRMPNQFLPPEEWLCNLDGTEEPADFAYILHPTIHYSSGENICPKSKVDPDYEYDNVILQLGPIEGYMGPYATSSISSIIASTQNQDIAATMDTIQIDVLNKIRYINYGKPEVKNFRIMIPQINVKYGKLHERGSSVGKFIETGQNHLYLDCRNINLVMRLTHPKTPQTLGEYLQSTEEIPTWKTVYFDVENFSMGIRRGHDEEKEAPTPRVNCTPFLFQIDQSEFWWNEEGGNNVGSLRIKSIDSSIMSEHIGWTTSFLEQNVQKIKEVEKNNHVKVISGQNRMAFVLHRLALGGEKFKIDHDPSVLTKPAYIIRSPQHVRASTSWKILIRLRYLMENVPKQWLNDQEKQLSRGDFTIDKNIKQQVVDIFTKWRSWELTNISESYFFRHSFVETSLKESLISTATKMHFGVENISVRLEYPDDEDFICFDYLSLMVAWGKASNEVIKTDAAVSCSNIRTRVSHNIVDIFDFLDEMNHLKQTISSSSMVVEVAPQETTPLPLLNLNLTVRLKLITGEAEMPSLSARADTREVRMSFLVNQLNTSTVQSSSVMHIDRIDNGVYWKTNPESKSVIGNLNVKGVTTSLTFSGDYRTCSKFLNFDAQDTHFVLDKDVVALSSILETFVKVDFQKFEKYLPSSRSRPIDATPQQAGKKSLPFIGPIYFSIKSRGLRLDFALLPSYFINYHCGEANIMMRQVDSTSFCCQINFEKLKLNVGTRIFGRRQRLLGLFFTQISSLSRIELAEGAVKSLNVAELLIEIDQVELSLESFDSTTIKAVTESLTTELDNAKASIGGLKDTISQRISFSGSKDTPSTTNDNNKQQVLANVNFIVQRVIVMIPIGKASLAFDTKKLSLRYSSFSLLDDGTVTRKPRFGGIFTDEFSVILLAQGLDRNASTLISGQGTITYQEHDKESKAKDRLEFSIDFLNVLLCPESIEWLFKIVETLKSNRGELSTSNLGHDNSDHQNTENAVDYSDTLKNFVERVYGVLSLNNVAIGWLFSSNSAYSRVPGILFGYEKFEIVAASFRAKTSLSGVYLCPAVERNIFVVNADDALSRPNTAYLPNIVLTVAYNFSEPYPELDLKLTGDSLRITCIPTIVNVVTSAMESFENTAASLNKWVKEPSRDVMIAKEAKSEIKSSAKNKRLRLPFSFYLLVEFEASIINLWSEVDFYGLNKLSDEKRDTSNVEPSLFLQTPSVKAEVGYTLVDDVNSPDALNMEVMVSSSNNTIHPRFVPVAVQMWNSVKVKMKENRRTISTPTVSKEEKNPWDDTSNGEANYDYVQEGSQFLKKLDVNVNVRFLRQEITLTCVPTAKVAASVSYDLFYFGINTCGDASRGKFLSLSCRLNNLKTSLQHIYSREVSGYASIENIMLFGAKNYLTPELDPVMVTGKVQNIMLDVNVKQMQDLELFMDIWKPSGVVPTPGLDEKEQLDWPKSESATEGYIMYKYRRATTTVAIPWSVSLAIINVQGVADMGQSIGKLSLELKKFWLSSQKSSNWEQNMMLGFDRVSLRSEGRLGGGVVLRKFHMRTAIMWEDVEGSESLPVPLVQAVVGLDSVESKLSLDYHVFALAYVKGLELGMSNQRDSEKLRGDRLLAVANCDVIDVYFTGLAASHFLDIYYTMIRLRNESNASYDEILKDSSGSTGIKQTKKMDPTLKNVIARLTTVLDLRLGSLNLYVFPNSLTDKVVFVTAIDGTCLQYTQDQKDGYLESKLSMRMNEFVVALSNMRKTFPAEDINQITVEDYVVYAAEAAKGGTIISVPVCDIDMNTWQEFGNSIIEYTFDSSFGGRIDVGWNLGSINFIRDMWNAHAKAFSARKETYAMRTTSRRLSTTITDENFKEVQLDSTYSYVPREPPIIAAPQLRDMGDATPPIEWIGLHRQRFPGLTHQGVILPLQSLVHDFELLYRQVLGRS